MATQRQPDTKHGEKSTRWKIERKKITQEESFALKVINLRVTLKTFPKSFAKYF